ncbi:hypothetical protein BD770DRAFT_399483 [Pilaira anomala]|nr:hypothetical protein BD770DRAFT_399483 [Pilaira anomala]
MNYRVDKRVDEVINEFFTDCPYGRKAISECPALSGHGENKKISENYASQFFNECPYGKRAQKQCPYGRRLSSDCSKYHPDFVDQYFMKCPSGRKAAEECPYGKEVLEKGKSYDHGKEIVEKARGYDHHHSGPSKHSDFAKEFFSECPYGKRATAECPYAREILAKNNCTNDSTIHPHHHRNSKQFDEFFTECPYGRKAAEECPYGHEVLEKAGIPVPPLKIHTDDTSTKCPFASMAGGDEKSKCPAGGLMPQSEKCPISPNYKKTLTPAVDFYENDKEFKLFVELPGIDKSNVKVDVKDKVLNLTAESKPISDLANENPHFTERKFGVYSRSISLPNNVCLKKVEAKMDNGILTITIPKGEPTVVTTITIK